MLPVYLCTQELFLHHKPSLGLVCNSRDASIVDSYCCDRVLVIVQGVGGSAVAGMKVKTGELSSIDLSDHQFHKIKCLFTDSDGLDHTLYSSGILCGDIMSRCTVILDYARSRIMFVPKNTDRPATS